MAQRTPDDKISLEIAELQKPMAGRRKLSWLLFLTVLFATLVLPMLAASEPAWLTGALGAIGLELPAKPRVMLTPKDIQQATWSAAKPAKVQHAPTPGALDAMWNPGPLASSHQTWAHDCQACHTEGFSRVKDSDCLVCHSKVTDHVDRRIAAHAGLTEVRCATCHRDHQGAFGLVEQNKRFTAENCAACHKDIKAAYPKTLTANVADFAREHPEFRVQVASRATKDAPAALTRVRLDQKPVEASTLKFPHDVHLVPAGADSPAGPKKMACADCHTPDAAGVNFKPVTMKDNCQSCHTLGFEPAVPGRQVPHGSVDEVLNTLREFYGYVASSGVPVDRPADTAPLFRYRPGKDAREPSFVQAPGDARARAAAAATELFEKTGCVVCHEVSRTSQTVSKGSGRDLPQWKIAPITPAHTWMPQAKFSHAAHNTAQCVDCHKAPSSKKSADVLMPGIETCRTCHAGTHSVANKIQSDCGVCHGFHLPAQPATPVKTSNDTQPARAQAGPSKTTRSLP